MVIKSDNMDIYDLYMRTDSNTNRRLNWYYFKVKVGKLAFDNPLKIKINIVNFNKLNCLYRNGLKPYIFSTKKFEHDGVGWK